MRLYVHCLQAHFVMYSCIVSKAFSTDITWALAVVICTPSYLVSLCYLAINLHHRHVVDLLRLCKAPVDCVPITYHYVWCLCVLNCFAKDVNTCRVSANVFLHYGYVQSLKNGCLQYLAPIKKPAFCRLIVLIYLNTFDIFALFHA